MSATYPRHATIVLAAGASRRLGAPKQLIQVDGESLLRRAVLAALQTRPAQSIVVLGAQSDAIFKTIADLAVQRIDCADWHLGMGASLGTGIMALDDSIAGALIVLCDQPALVASHLQRMIDAWRTSPSRAVASAYSGTLGVPALVPRASFADLLELRGDYGARELLRSRPNEVVAIDAPDLERDVDFPSDI
ncbi:MAG: nucleotidyltransferase family protein [Dokdonella sp.]